VKKKERLNIVFYDPICVPILSAFGAEKGKTPLLAVAPKKAGFKNANNSFQRDKNVFFFK